MASKKILVVFGATGKQGESVIKSILEDPITSSQFSVRAIISRNPSVVAQALIAHGVECVQADLNDHSSVLAAIKGAHSLFAVTDCWESGSPKIEIQQGKHIADAAKEVGVRHIIWSSLLNVTILSKGKLRKVTHFDSKAEVEEYIRALELPATFFLAGFYMSNIAGRILNNRHGAYNFGLPIPTDSPIPLFDAVRDTGKFVKAILLNRDKLLGARVYGAADYYTPKRIVEEFQEVKPQDGSGGSAIQVPDETFKNVLGAMGLPEHLQEEILENLHLLPQFGYFGGTNLNESHSILVDPLTTWKEFVEHEPIWTDLK